jgi:hypothetical protein
MCWMAAVMAQMGYVINAYRLPSTDIYDGRNRYRACAAAGVEPTLTTYTGADPLGHVLSLNFHRRHLTVSQKSLVFAKIATLERGRPSENTAIAVIIRLS